MKTIKAGFTQYAAEHTDLLPNIIEAFEHHIVNAPDPDAYDFAKFGDAVDDLIRDNVIEYGEHLEKEDKESGYDEEDQPSHGFNGSVNQ